MRKEKMNYGNLVYLDPVIYTDAYQPNITPIT